MTRRPIEAEVAFRARANTGESPTWSETEQALYWIDIEEPALHRLSLSTGQDEHWEMPAEIGAFALCRSGGIIVALRTCLAKLSLAQREFTHIAASPHNPLTHRFNDGKCDENGRLWVGAMHDPLAAPLQQDRQPQAARLCVFSESVGLGLCNVSAVIGNGLAWSPDSKTAYFSDSHARTVWAFDFALERGELSSQRVLAQFSPSDGAPDGAAVDAEGFYWCALYGGGRVVRLSPQGRLDREILLPVSQPTMCAFGDADYETLYITTAAKGVEERESDAGSVFRCRPGVRGRPPALFADG